MRFALAIGISLLATALYAEDITVATWNIENFGEHFAGHAMDQRYPRDGRSPELDEAIRLISYQNTEEQWEIASVIMDEGFRPDVLMMQEAADESDLRFFNRKWLKGLYTTVMVFPTNTDRGQNLAMFLKKGFRLIKFEANYHLERDPDAAADSNQRLFARGPAFALIESPSGYRFWCGTTHQKSKATGAIPDLPNTLEGQDWEKVKLDEKTQEKKIEATKWRNKEARRTNAIINELKKVGPADVMLVGDMNDDYGLNRFDAEGGGDTIAILLGEGDNALTLLTKPLVEAGKKSFAGYWRTNEAGFIDHIIVTKEMADQTEEVKVFENRFTPVASDHMPVMVRFKADAQK